MATKIEALASKISKGMFKVTSTKGSEGGGAARVSVIKTWEEHQKDWQDKFAKGKEFLDAVNDNVIVVTNKVGEKVNMTCMDRAMLQEYLKSGEKPGAIQGAAKRRLALAGIILAKGKGRGIVYDPKDDAICIYPDRLEKAPGKNIQTQVVHAKAAVQGSKKFKSLFASFERAKLEVDVTEAGVVTWLKETKRFTGRTVVRKVTAEPKVPKAPKKGKK